MLRGFVCFDRTYMVQHCSLRMDGGMMLTSSIFNIKRKSAEKERLQSRRIPSLEKPPAE